MTSTDSILATGRRKTSVAQVRAVRQGQGKIVVNTQSVDDYFKGHERQKNSVVAPLKLVEEAKQFDYYVKVQGGGITGQAEAVRHGLARALAQTGLKSKQLMRKEGFLTRDPRMVERKKAGQPKARKRFQYSKR
ncbi:MAG: 30S ribosomal protein S9 [Elusimicrobia bacterium]|nr:30S ribosomal protein S9 [Elusimicrobiota bacterium]